MQGNRRAGAAKKVEIMGWEDFPPMNVSLGNMLHNHTGSWRFIKPIYEDKTPACQNACPCANDVEAWIKLAQGGKVDEAFLFLKREQPFPSVLGRVCFRFCETECNRAGLDEAISIRELERYIGDKGLSQGILPDTPALNGKSLGVVGSGPSGMSVAYFARLLGFKVTVYEAYSVLGGILRIGIPAYRLPREVLLSEFELLRKMGIELKTGIRIGKDLSLEKLCREHDYIFLGAGAHQSRRLGLKGEELSARVIPGLRFLTEVALGSTPDLGKHVTVVGGGNTAIDAARTAVRLGAQEVTVLYRRTEAEMPAHPDEVREAREEGVRFQFLAAPERIDIRGDGSINLQCVEMELGPPDESGRRSPVKKEGAEFQVSTDTAIVAIGEDPFFPPLVELLERNELPAQVDRGHFVCQPFKGAAKVYAGGDLTAIPHTVVHAVASGKRAAIAMDCDRKGLAFEAVEKDICVGDGTGLSFSRYLGLQPLNPVRQDWRKVVTRENIVYDYFEKAARVSAVPKRPEERVRNFKPYLATLEDHEALSEFTRCIHCGRCIECDNCLIFCPDVSILVEPESQFGYKYDYDYCKGCGICFSECPRNAITMIDEEAEIKEE